MCVLYVCACVCVCVCGVCMCMGVHVVCGWVRECGVVWCCVLSRACWSLSSSLFAYCCDYLIVDSCKLCIIIIYIVYAVSRACHCCCRCLLKSCGKQIVRVIEINNVWLDLTWLDFPADKNLGFLFPQKSKLEFFWWTVVNAWQHNDLFKVNCLMETLQVQILFTACLILVSWVDNLQIYSA